VGAGDRPPRVALSLAGSSPIVAALGAIFLFLKRTRGYREAASRSSSSRAEIDRILLEAKIREAKQREAEAHGSEPAS
jgi:hypothetical protein